MSICHSNNAVYWYLDEITSQIVAKSGIPSDRYHLGKIMMHVFKEDPDFIHQIDGGTGAKETTGSMLKRSTQCAIGLKKLGIQKGDVIVLMAPNHLDIGVPFYATMYLGVIVYPVDRTLGKYELHETFKASRPKIVFCHSDKVSDVDFALKSNDLDTTIVLFDKVENKMCFTDLLNVNDEELDSFKPTEYDPDSIGFLIPTSGTTGFPKCAAVTYKNILLAEPSIFSRFTKFPTPFQKCLVVSPLQWLSCLINFIVGAYLRYTRVQTSKPVTESHVRYLIETYKPNFTALSPTVTATLLKKGDQGACDISSFDMILLGGSAVPKELVEEINAASPKTVVSDAYGMSELASICFHGPAPPGSSGKPTNVYQIRLVHTETQQDIIEPNLCGELWVKGPMFIGYYNDPETTRQVFTEDGWFKTGDTFYRDEDWNYYFVERIKLLLKYKSYQISPVEVEKVIRQHPGVMDVAVTGILDPEYGDLPVACVVPRPEHKLTIEDVQHIVKENLSDAKQLRGGVIFMDELPLTASTKINRRKLKEMVLIMKNGSQHNKPNDLDVDSDKGGVTNLLRMTNIGLTN